MVCTTKICIGGSFTPKNPSISEISHACLFRFCGLKCGRKKDMRPRVRHETASH